MPCGTQQTNASRSSGIVPGSSACEAGGSSAQCSTATTAQHAAHAHTSSWLCDRSSSLSAVKPFTRPPGSCESLLLPALSTTSAPAQARPAGRAVSSLPVALSTDSFGCCGPQSVSGSACSPQLLHCREARLGSRATSACRAGPKGLSDRSNMRRHCSAPMPGSSC